jgi:hypothetical protein
VYAAVVVVLPILGGTDARGLVQAIGGPALMIVPLSLDRGE